MSAHGPRTRITAVLGPTNTGKTHFAIERLLTHSSGVIGFPLRLLARENYERVVRLKGAARVALVTGEEKIVPARARYFLCTAESMPLDRPFDFVAIDEIQMCADAERGHVFTERLLGARGLVETMFLGADTMRALIRKLVPEAAFVGRPRLSRLSYAGARKLTRLPRRSAVIAFSAGRVYEIAELLRRQCGGAAIVLGALSPRTRSAQVAMFQDGEVDYLVATDAIGMGLNMRLDHVAFHERRKFDGRIHRALCAAELAQIAGRAGRYMSDGTFGAVATLGALEPEIVEAVESHRFAPLTAIQWRNGGLDFRSPAALVASLEARPPRSELARAREGDDQRALAALLRDEAVNGRARDRDTLRLLWEVCQIPDYRKTMAEAHARLLATVFGHLAGPAGRLPTDWIARRIADLDRTDGDIDTLMARIAHVRTWSYISHRGDWIDDSAAWRARARAVEDRLSDALHRSLTQRFVDRRAAILRRAGGGADLHAAVDPSGEVRVEGEPVGRIDGFRFVPDMTESDYGRRALAAATDRVLRREIDARAARLAEAGDEAFGLSDDAVILWRGTGIARLSAGAAALAPGIEIDAGDALGRDRLERVRARLSAWLNTHLATGLAPLHELAEAGFAGAARGLAFQLVEALGSVRRRAAGPLLADIGPRDRRAMRRLGVRFGIEAIYLPALIKPRAARLRALLWSVHNRQPPRAAPTPGLCSVPAETGVDTAFYAACGYRVLAGRAIRVDILDRLAIALSKAARAGPFAPTAAMIASTGLTAEQAPAVLDALGYRRTGGGEETRYFRVRPDRRRPRKRGAAARPAEPGSPFAILRGLERSG